MAQTTRGVWTERIGDVKAGVLVLLLAAVVVYFVFTKANPLARHYEVHAVVESANLVVPGAPVRVAGVAVGKVVAVGRYRKTHLADLTLRIDDRAAKPIRRDAEVKIRPRLFLEGNFYVDLQPGRPGSPALPNGGTLPVAQSAVPVQLDQALGTLRGDARSGLQQTLQGLGTALGSRPTPEEDATQAPMVRGLTGGQALNEGLRTAPLALRDGTIVADALRGQTPGDLPRMLRGFGAAARGLARDQAALTALVRDFDATVATTALHAAGLRGTVRELARVGREGRAPLRRLRAVLPGTRALARELAVGFDEVPAAIQAARPWLAQARPLLGARELGGLSRQLAPTVADLARVTHAGRRTVGRGAALARCANDVLIPTANLRVQDGQLSSGAESYKELWYGMVGQASETQFFDGNGFLMRLGAASSDRLLRSGNSSTTGRSSRSTSAVRPQFSSPAFAGVAPPLRRDRPCDRNPVPDVNGPASRGPADGSRPGAAAPPAPQLVSTPPAEVGR